VTDKARDELAHRGYDPSFGARPLRRVVQNELQNPLASELLKGEFSEGSTIRIDYDGQEFTFASVGGGNGAPRKGSQDRGDKIVSADVV
jgi:ATP-dependent Clp protease ATP-binding subunit ClpA